MANPFGKLNKNDMVTLRGIIQSKRALRMARQELCVPDEEKRAKLRKKRKKH